MPCPKDFSRTNLIGRAYVGSQRQIQTYVNERTEAFNSAVAQSLSHTTSIRKAFIGSRHSQRISTRNTETQNSWSASG